MTVSLSGCIGICLYLMIFHTNGECFSDELSMTEYGCITSFEILNLQIALVMMFIDTILFGMFCYKWWQIVSLLKPAECSNNKIPARVWQGFAIQFICVTVAMASCSIDGIINYLYMDYDTLLVFVVDCALVSTANFAMLKESQQFLGKQLKTIFCIDIIRFRSKTESDESVKNLESVVNDDNNINSNNNDNIGSIGSITSKPTDMSLAKLRSISMENVNVNGNISTNGTNTPVMITVTTQSEAGENKSNSATNSSMKSCNDHIESPEMTMTYTVDSEVP